tara:strand:+ start:5885 stop:6766 length:882 start_codon:yes stop_codon:yes gene_type:complete
MVKTKNILVTGSSGQLGSELFNISSNYNNYSFVFMSRNELDINNHKSFIEIIEQFKINLIINCAAYTNVEKSEEEKEICNLTNAISVDKIAKICEERSIQLIHISTDFVFDGNKTVPYTEIDEPNPINYYGLTKFNGEKFILKYDLKKSIIIRTSWLYSSYGKNFVNNIIDRIKIGKKIDVVENEIGSPTNAMDLARFILEITPKLNNSSTEIYNFSNSEFCSRYEFAVQINDYYNGGLTINPVTTNNIKIARPRFTALNCNKIEEVFNAKLKSWKDSLLNHIIHKKTYLEVE